MRRRLLIVGLLLILALAGFFWWQSGFTLDFMRFFAAEPDRLSVQCGTTQNIVTWTHHPLADSNSIQRGGPAFQPKNLPDCADYWCWLPTIDYPHQLPGPGNPATYIDTQPMPGVCHEYRIKYQPILPSNSVFCPTNCNLPPPTTPPPTTPPPTTPPPTTPPPTSAPPIAPIVLTANPGAVVCTGDDPRPTVLSWNVVSGIVSYTVKRGTTAGGPYTVIASGLTAPPHADSAQAGTFFYVVSGVDSSGSEIVTSNEVRTDIPVADCPTPAPPTVDILCSNATGAPNDGPCEIPTGSTSTLTWNSTNVTFCTASGGWTGARVPQGSEPSPVLTSSQTFILTCTGPGGTASDQVVVNVTAAPTATPPPPTVDIKCSVGNAAPSDGPCQVTSGSSATLSWTSANAATCTASGGWTGTKATQGSQSSGTLTSSQTFVITCTNASGGSASDQVVVNVTAAPTATPPPTPPPTPTPPPLVCAPANQTVTTGQSANFGAGGGTSPLSWFAQNGSPTTGQGSTFSTTHSSAGTFPVRVTDSRGRAATCTVIVTATQAAPTTPALTIQKTVRNISSAGAEGENANVSPGQTVEFIIRVSSIGTGTATQVTVHDVLPAGITYTAGSTTVDAVPAPDGITGSGLSVGDMPSGRTVTIRFRATVAAASFFNVGTTVLTNTATAQAAGASASAATNVQNTALVSVVVGATTPVQVPTGPGESAVLALVISAIATLLYVGYASTATFTRHEAESLARKGKDDIDSLNFRR